MDRFFDLSHDMLAIADRKGYFTRVNCAFTATLGWTREQLLSAPMMSFVHPEDVQDTVMQLAKLKHGCEATGFRHRFAHVDGGWRWLEWRASPDPERQVAYGAARDVTDAVRMQYELEARESVLRELVAVQVRVRDDELQRIAGDLHDTVVQHLIATLMYDEGASVADDAQSVELHQRSRAELRHALAHLRRIMQGIDPLDVGFRELDAAVREQAREIAERHDIAVHVELELPPRLRGMTAGAAYRIVREAMTNAGKHSRGRNVRVQLGERDGCLHVCVRDDGSPAQDGTTRWRGAGVGTMLMRDRAASVGGTLDVQYTETGTRVTAKLPISPPGPDISPSVAGGRALAR